VSAGDLARRSQPSVDNVPPPRVEVGGRRLTGKWKIRAMLHFCSPCLCATRRHIQCAVIALALLTAGTASAAELDLAQKGKNARVELILSNLPAKGSKAYDELVVLAGKGATRQLLPMTQSEIWSTPKRNADAVKKGAAARGVGVYELDADWNEVFRPMPGTRGSWERKKAVKDRATSSPETMRTFMTEKQRIMQDRAKSSKAVTAVTMVLAAPPGAVEYALTRPVSDADRGQIKLPINEKSVLTITRTSVEASSGMLIWGGKVDGTGMPVTLLWWPDGRMTGTVQHDGHIYSIRHMGGDMHAIVEMSEDRMPTEHGTMPSRLRTPDPRLRDEPLIEQERTRSAAVPQAAVQGEAEGATGEVIVDVIMAYTPKAARNYTDIRREVAELSIEQANESFRRSNLGNIKLRLVHAYQTDYVEQGEYFDHVWRFADAGDGYMEEIHALREQYRADVAVLIMDDPSACGLATRVFADANEAFAVVHHECAAATYSVAHEIGHLIGARHDLNFDTTKWPFPYGHGYYNDSMWRDIMSLRESCGGCVRLPIWSSPNVMVDGEPAGTSDCQDNARVIAEQAARVAAFR
jgi:hypothetical protein